MCPWPPACDFALSIQEGEEDVAAASGRRGKRPWHRAGARRAAGGEEAVAASRVNAEARLVRRLQERRRRQAADTHLLVDSAG